MDDRTSQEATPSRVASTNPSFDPRDLIPTPLFCASPEGRLAWMNAAAEALTGRHAASVAGEPFSVLFPDEVRMKMARHMLRQRRRGITEYYVEAPLVTAGAESHWVGLQVRLATAANGRTAYVCAAHDLHEIHSNLETLQRRNRELAARLEEATAGAELKSTFLATMSHELRAPMNGVIGMSRLLLDSQLDRDQRTWAEVIQSSGDQLLELVDDILDYSRIESGQLTIGSMDFDLRVTVDAVASLLATRAHDTGVAFTSLVHHRVPSLLNGDPGRLRQVLLHLADCALDQAAGGELQLRVELVEETAHQAVVRFWLNRIGGPLGGSPESEDGLIALFDGEPDGAQRMGGRALGLTIGRRLVSLMGGDGGANRVPEMGSKLWFRVPLGKQVERPAAAPAPAGAPRSDAGHVRALIVDGDAAARAALVESITAWGGSCEPAEGGLEAIERLKAAASTDAPFAVAIVDLDVPELDAEGFARAVRDDAGLRSLPLVLVTSLGRPGDAARAESWGYNAYFVKPVDAAELRPAIAALLTRDGSAGDRLVTRHTVAEMKKRAVRVLVVEDNAIDQLVIASALRRVGYTPEMVGTVEEAAAAIARQASDIVFIDVAAGGDDGYRQAAGLRTACDAASGAGTRTPIVALVGRVREEEKASCTAAGIDDLLGKPVDLEALVATVGRWVEGRAEETPAEFAPESASEPIAESVEEVPTTPAFEPAPEPVAEETATVERLEVEPRAEWMADVAPEPVVPAFLVEPAAVVEAAPETVAESWNEPVTETWSEPVAEIASEPAVVAAADPLADLPVLDAACLDQASLGNSEIRGLLVDAFLTRTRQPLDRLKKAAEWKDAKAVEFQAHTIRGMCESVGAARCASVLATIEGLAQGGSLDDETSAALGRVDEELASVRAQWNEWRAATAEGGESGVAQAA